MLFGRHQVLEALLDEVDGRDIGGSSGEKINWAKRGLWLLKNKHDMAIPSGPTALDRILALDNPDYVRPQQIASFHPTFDGATLDADGRPRARRGPDDAHGVPRRTMQRSRCRRSYT